MKKLLCGAVLLVVASPVMANADYDALLKRYNDLHPVAEKVITLSTYIKNNAIGSFNEYNNGDVEALKNMHMLLNKLDGFGKELGEPLHNAPYSSCGSVSAMTGLYWDAVMSAKNGISDDKIENIDRAKINMTKRINECKYEALMKPEDDSKRDANGKDDRIVIEVP